MNNIEKVVGEHYPLYSKDVRKRAERLQDTMSDAETVIDYVDGALTLLNNGALEFRKIFEHCDRYKEWIYKRDVIEDALSKVEDGISEIESVMEDYK